MSDTHTRLLKSIRASERIIDIIHSEQETDTHPFEFSKLKGAIQFKDVNFFYPTRSDEVLKGMNFIQPGEKLH